jgi:hypothetical protein
MKEIRPGILMVRRTKKNKLKEFKQDVIAEKSRIESTIQDKVAQFEEKTKQIDEDAKQIQHEVSEKYERGKIAVNGLQELANDVQTYIKILDERGIDIDYIKNNAEQIKTIFFAVLELIENGETGTKNEMDSRSAAASAYVWGK